MAEKQNFQSAPGLGRRSISSLSWNLASSLLVTAVGLVRSILLARLVSVEAFGVYGWSGSVVVLSGVIGNFGLPNAFVHRTAETDDEEEAAASYFVLRLLLSGIWLLLLSAYAVICTTGQTRVALLVLAATAFLGGHMTQIPRYLLIRRVVHRRIAVFQILDALLSSLIAVLLAWRGFNVWALLATDIVGSLLSLGIFYMWKPVWRPHFAWNPQQLLYYLGFGRKQVLVDVLRSALDRVDDLWTGVALGDLAMGYYSKAYTFASYPRKILATPVNQVALGAYAELKDDRQRLSQAFYRFNSLLIRSGFLLAGALYLVAPEFISLLLTEKWLPMLSAFRLMLVYTLFDPLKMTIAAVFTAVGKPAQVASVHAVQLVVLVTGLILLGPRMNIAGVALAVDIMLVVGIMLLFRRSRRYVDFSLPRLFGSPLLGLGLGIASGYAASSISLVVGSDWSRAAAKLLAYTMVYGGTLLLLEGREAVNMWRILVSYYK